MDGTKKVFNVLGIIAAWILSIALVIMLTVTPIVLSTLELLDVNTLVETVTDALVDQIAPSGKTADNYNNGMSRTPSPTVTKLAESSDAVSGTVQSGEGVLKDLFGDSVTPEVMEKILASKAAKQFIAAYADGFSNALTGKGSTRIDAELIKKIINDNIDEVVELVKLASPNAANMTIEEIKQKITESVDQTAEQITKTLPQPEQIKDAVLEENPELEVVLQIIARKDSIKAVYVGAVAILCILIFLCRIPGYRGFRWLATDLFVGGGFCALQSAGLLVAAPMVKGLIPDASIAGLAAGLLTRFTTGVAVRTGVMLVCAVALLVAYIFIKKALAKKGAAPAEKYDIIVLAGQSNAEGQGQGEVTEEYVPDARIHFMNDNCGFHFVTTDGVSVLHYNWPCESKITVADERIEKDKKMGCFALQFAQKYAAEYLAEDRKVLIVNANFGGTGFHRPEWGVGNIMHERMVAMTNEALGYNPENKVVAVLWAQGEHDAFEDADWDAERRYLTHKENLTATFADFYARTGCQDAPIIACGFTDTYCQSVPEASEAVLKAIVECVAEVNGGFVDTKGLTSNAQVLGNDDIYHYSREALHILGGKLFDKYKEMKG